MGLRAYAQRDPLVEYQREGFDMFNQMLDGVKEEAVGFLFNLEVQVEPAPRGHRRRRRTGAHAGQGAEPGRAAPPAAAALLGAEHRRRGRAAAAPVLVRDAEPAAPAARARGGRGKPNGARSGGRSGAVAPPRPPQSADVADTVTPGRRPRPAVHRDRCSTAGASGGAAGSGASVAGRAGGGQAGIIGASSAARLGGAGMVAAGGSSPGAQAANKLPAPGQALGSGPARNGPCPCGSGKKYKRCHGAPNA